jgi:hypothetical protein
VYARGADGVLVFHRLARLTARDVEEVLATIEPLVARRLRRRCGRRWPTSACR